MLRYTLPSTMAEAHHSKTFLSKVVWPTALESLVLERTVPKLMT